MNRELGNEEKTRALFKQLAGSPDKALAQQCFSVAQDVLVSYGDYELCRDFIGDPENRFKNIQDQWQRSKKWENQREEMQHQMEERMHATQKQFESNGMVAAPLPRSALSLPKLADQTFVGQTRQLIEILVGTHSKADAEKIRSEALALLDDPRLKSAVEDAEKKIQKGIAQDEAPTMSGTPPVVVATFPASGTRDVPAGETEIRVRFSKPMQDGSWSWSTAWENSTPETVGAPHYIDGGRTCVLKVRLEPGHSYAWWLNSETFHNFRDQAGHPAVPYLLIFQTKPN